MAAAQGTSRSSACRSSAATTRRGEWDGGTILDPDNGKVYRCKIELRDGGQKPAVRGLVGISRFGRTQVWDRAESDVFARDVLKGTMTAIRQSKPRLEGHKPSKTFGEFSPVTLTIPVTYRGVTFPKGARGVVVHQHDDGIGYEVEFETPMQAVLTLTSEQIQ